MLVLIFQELKSSVLLTLEIGTSIPPAIPQPTNRRLKAYATPEKSPQISQIDRLQANTGDWLTLPVELDVTSPLSR